MPTLDNLKGQRFGGLAVLRQGPTGISHNARWWCRCDCGKRKLVRGDKLRGGLTQSCGCLSRGRLA